MDAHLHSQARAAAAGSQSSSARRRARRAELALTTRDRAAMSRWSRALTLVLLAAVALGYFLRPATPLGFALDVLVRAYCLFLLGALGHEAAHGHMASSRRANLWWGRAALFFTLVPFVKLRRTHALHHAHTNEAGRDPDLFLKSRRSWETPLRALWLSQHWLVWLKRTGRLRRADVVEMLLTYAATLAAYALLAQAVGWVRPLAATLPALVLQCWLVWIAFGVKTHEGHSTGAPEERSHNYYGRALFWATLGLSMHRAHHMKPQLPWLALLPDVEPKPRGAGFGPVRDRVLPAAGARVETP